MKIVSSILLVLALFFLKSEAANTKAAEYKTLTYDGGKYTVVWKYDMIEDTFYFNETVQATGWIRFGVSENKGNMQGYDVMVGGVRNTNQGYHKVGEIKYRLWTTDCGLRTGYKQTFLPMFTVKRTGIYRSRTPKVSPFVTQNLYKAPDTSRDFRIDLLFYIAGELHSSIIAGVSTLLTVQP